MPNELAPYAAAEDNSRGRLHAESSPAYRGEFQRDRDRIIHSAAFRRLEYKTQVFVNHEGDMFRTRLTHSIEVAQIARTIARALRLNEELTEAIALAHDLGHTPFGHAGQDALNACMQEFGGFEHNVQSLRVVELLEEKYAEFDGLNLTFEAREGILKHCPASEAEALGAVAQRFISGGQASLEAQVADLSDAIAYNCHDVDDGLRSGLLELDQLHEVSLFKAQLDVVLGKWPQLATRRVIHEVVRRIISQLVIDLVETSEAAIDRAAPDSIAAIRDSAHPLIQFSAPAAALHAELKKFLRKFLYSHHRVHRMTVKAQRVVTGLFEAYMHDPRVLAPKYQQRIRAAEGERGQAGRARVVADYIAGMTDRYAISQYEQTFNPLKLG